jgi:uncharacterized protein (TIGR02217 family)
MTTPAFHEVRFPIEVALGARGGPERRTEIVTLASGREERNARWAHSRRRYDAGHGVRTLATLAMVVAFFEERRGRLTGFRYRDPLDHASCAPGGTVSPTDQTIGTGDGSTAVFQLAKSYGAGASAYIRPILKPVAGTARVAVAGVEKTASQVTVDPATGKATFAPGHVPATGAAITAGFEFDVPVRFDTDALSIDLSSFRAGEIPSIPLVEIVP